MYLGNFTVCDSWLHEAVCRQGVELWPVFDTSSVTALAVTHCSLSSSLWPILERQSIAVLQYSLYHYYIYTASHYAVLLYVQCYHLPNCTATPLLFFKHLITVYLNYIDVEIFQNFYQSYSLWSHIIIICFPFRMWHSWLCGWDDVHWKIYLKNPVDILTVTVVIRRAYCTLNF
jgi:hypothetical protein